MLPRPSRGGGFGSQGGGFAPHGGGAVAPPFPQLPPSLADLNAIFRPFAGVEVFQHSWGLDEPSGAGTATDQAPSGGVTLTRTDAAVQGVLTGLPGGDRGVSFSEGNNNRMEGPDAGALDVTTGDLIVLATVKLPTLPAAQRSILGKGSTAYWILYLQVTGTVVFNVFDGAVNPTPTVAQNHCGATFVDLLGIVAKSPAAKRATLTTSLGDSGLGPDIAALGSLSSINRFGIATVPGLVNPPEMIATYCAIGTVLGDLQTNRIPALSAYRRARGAE